MNKTMLITAGITVVLIAILTAGPALARRSEFPYGLGGGRLGGHLSGLRTAEKVLGLGLEELTALREKGKSLAEIAHSIGLPKKDLIDRMVAMRLTTLEELVAEGEIDEETAETIAHGMRERIEACVEREEFRQGAGDGAVEGSSQSCGECINARQQVRLKHRTRECQPDRPQQQIKNREQVREQQHLCW